MNKIFQLFMLILAISLPAETLNIKINNKDVELTPNISTVNERWVLQTSRNLKLWTDINDSIFEINASEILYKTPYKHISRYYRLIQWKPLSPITIAIIGDSTASTNGGWARGFENFIRSNVTMLHLAYPWQSTKRFIDSERFIKLITDKPQYVFLQFGLMDSQHCGGEPDDCFTSDFDFEKNIVFLISEIRKYSGIPILITPPSLNYFDETTNQVGHWFPNRCVSIKKIGILHEVPVVDLNNSTRELFNFFGKQTSVILNWPNDSIHFSLYGAPIIAGLVSNELPDYVQKHLIDPQLKY